MREIQSSKISCKSADGSELMLSSINHPLDIATGRDRVFGVGNMPQMIDLCGTMEPEPAQEPAFLLAPIDLSKIHQQDTRQQSLIIQDLTTSRKKLELENQNLRDQLDFANDIIRRLREGHKNKGDNLPDNQNKHKKMGNDSKRRYFSSREIDNEEKGTVEGRKPSRRASSSVTAKTRIKFWAKHQNNKKPPSGLTKKETFQNPLGGPKKFDVRPNKIETSSTCAKSSSSSSSCSSRSKSSSKGKAEPADSSTIFTRSSTGPSSQQPSRRSVSGPNDCGSSRFEGSYKKGVVRSSTGALSQQPSHCSVSTPSSCSISRFEGSYRHGTESSSQQPSFGSVSSPNPSRVSRYEGGYQSGTVNGEPDKETCITSSVPDDLIWLCAHSADSTPSRDSLYDGDKYQNEAVHSALGLTRSNSTASTQSRDSLIDGDKYQCEGEMPHY